MLRLTSAVIMLLALTASAPAGPYAMSAPNLNLFPHSKGTPIRGFIGAAGIGVSKTGQLTVTGDVGFGVGRANVGSLFRGPWCWFVAASPTVEWSRETTVPSLAMMAGIANQPRIRGVPFMTFGVAGGVEARFDERTLWGPTVKARFGGWWLTLFAQASYFHGEDDVSVRVGLELLRFPEVGVGG